MNEENNNNSQENLCMEEQSLELRMYFFVLNSLVGISKGIMCGHAALEYADKYGSDEQFVYFVRDWKTWIILNGGTTNDQRDFEGIPSGTLNQLADQLLENDIQFAYFREPDLNDALTALCFICDERVFNKVDYPDFVDYLIQTYKVDASAKEIIEIKITPYKTLMENTHYKEWIRLIGGVKNEFLRELLRDKKLA